MNPLTALRETGQLWDLLADSGSEDKWFHCTGKMYHVGQYIHACPTCEYASNKCADCLVWSNDYPCYDGNGEFNDWIDAKTKKQRSIISCQIATLAWENYGLLYSIGYRED